MVSLQLCAVSTQATAVNLIPLPIVPRHQDYSVVVEFLDVADLALEGFAKV